MKLRALGLLKEMEQVSHLRSKLQQLPIKFSNIVDVGCGSGHFFRMISNIKPDCSYVGIDINSNYLKIAKNIFKQENAKFIKANSNNLSFIQDNTFDICICYMLMPFIKNYKTTLKECMRITKNYLFLRLLISDHTYYIQRHFPNNLKFFYNIYSESEFRKSSFELGAKKVDFFEEKTGLKIPQKNTLDTYTKYGMQISGQIILPWQYVTIEK